MDNAVIEKCREDLVAEATKLEEQADALKKELAEVKANQRRIASFIAKLEGGDARERKVSKPSMKGVEVRQLVASVLKQVPSISEEKLYELLKAQAEKAGHTSMGLKLRMQEALASEEIEVSNEEVSLRTSESSRASA